MLVVLMEVTKVALFDLSIYMLTFSTRSGYRGDESCSLSHLRT